MGHRSVSQYLTWTTKCRWAYKLARRDHLDGLPAAWTVAGLAFHTAAQAFHESGDLMTISEVQRVFATDYDQRIAECMLKQPDLSVWLRGGRTSTEKDIETRRLRGIAQMEDYIMYHARSGLSVMIINGMPAVEKEVRLNAGSFDVLGYIDLILIDSARTALIRDNKTGELPDWAFQLVTYGYALEDTEGIKAYWGDFYSAKKGTVSTPIDLTYISREECVTWYKQMDAEETAGHYMPNPGKHCFTCDQKLNCRHAA